MKLIQSLLKGDRTIWLVYFIFIMISVIEVFSASSSLSYRSGNHMLPILKHCQSIGIGIVAAYLFHLIPYKYFRFIPYTVLPVTYIALAITMAMGFFSDSRVNGAARWLWGIQPAEIGKGALMISVAFILGKYQREEGCSPLAFKPILCITGLMFLLIAPENGSTALMIAFIVFLMLIIGRIPFKQLLKLTVVSGLAVSAFISIIVITPAKQYRHLPLMHRVETWQNRINRYFEDDKAVSPAEYDTDKDAQIAHANIAIASSHIIGKGPGNSVQREFLPQAYSDFIYAIIIEELGLAGGAAVVFLYIILLFRVLLLTRKSNSNFASFLMIGLALTMVIQAFVNMAVATGIAPVTGQNLTFISRGGSSMLFSSIYIGMIISVSRYIEESALKAEIKKLPIQDNNDDSTEVQS